MDNGLTAFDWIIILILIDRFKVGIVPDWMWVMFTIFAVIHVIAQILREKED